MFNAEGDDDDCKYHIIWTSTPVRENASVTFTVTLTNWRIWRPTPAPALHAEVS